MGESGVHRTSAPDSSRPTNRLSARQAVPGVGGLATRLTAEGSSQRQTSETTEDPTGFTSSRGALKKAARDARSLSTCAKMTTRGSCQSAWILSPTRVMVSGATGVRTAPRPIAETAVFQPRPWLTDVPARRAGTA